MVELRRGEAIPANQFIALLDLHSMPLGHKLSLERTGLLLARQGISLPILQSPALRMVDLPRGSIPVKPSTALQEPLTMPPGHKPCQEPATPSLVRQAILPLTQMFLALRMERLPRGAAIPVSLFIALEDFRPMPSGPKPWAITTGRILAWWGIMHLQVHLCTALKMVELLRGVPIPANPLPWQIRIPWLPFTMSWL